MGKIFAFLLKLVSPDKIGGWVRAGVAAVVTAGAGFAISKVPVLGQIFPADQIGTVATAAGAAVATVVTGILSNISKS